MSRLEDEQQSEVPTIQATALNRLENLAQLRDVAAEHPELGEFLDHAALATDVQNDEGGDAVSLMTLHSSKGLEFPVVFIVGMSENRFPSQWVVTTRDLEEERRLAYVGVTRAEKQLFLSYTKEPSRFIKEIPTHLVGSG